jgi:hypothetical protein
MNGLVTFIEVAVVPVLVAAITALGVWLGNRKGEARSRVLRQENTQQHAEGRALLEHLSVQVGGIDRKVDRLDHRLDGVQMWQADHEKVHLLEES